MAAFRVGDRVRIKNDDRVEPAKYRGMETTITGPCFHHHLSGLSWPVACYPEGAAERVLEPLTPPAVDAWASEQVKKWTKLEPQPEKLPTLREVMDYYRSKA